MNDEQLVAFFKRQSTGSVCGRFRQDQLDRSIEIPEKRIPCVKYFFQFALPAFLLSKKASAQGEVRVLNGDTGVMPVTPKIETVKRIAGIVRKRERLICGRVIDETGEGFSYSTIFVKGTTIGVAAESTKNISLRYSGQERTIELVSSCVGFKKIETIVDFNKIKESITTSLPSDNTVMEVNVVANTEKMGSMILGRELLVFWNE